MGRLKTNINEFIGKAMLHYVLLNTVSLFKSCLKAQSFIKCFMGAVHCLS